MSSFQFNPWDKYVRKQKKNGKVTNFIHAFYNTYGMTPGIKNASKKPIALVGCLIVISWCSC